MHVLGRIIIGLLAVALGGYAIHEIIEATDPKVGLVAFMLLFVAIFGLVESLRTHPKR